MSKHLYINKKCHKVLNNNIKILNSSIFITLVYII